ncbi:MAG: TRAP transporter small permease [Rhodobacteraceae bacterium]|nr:TRAP transporter small permease [Paracoccaceae bacterium]
MTETESQAPSPADRILDRAVETVAIIGFTGLVAIAFLTMADVTLRYLSLPRVPGFKDLNEVAYAIVVASCFPAGLKKGNAVTVRLLGKLLGARWHAWLEVVGATAMLILFGLCAWQFGIRASLFSADGRTTSTLEWPTGPVWWLVTALFATCVAVQAWVLVQSVTAARRGSPRPIHEDYPE